CLVPCHLCFLISAPIGQSNDDATTSGLKPEVWTLADGQGVAWASALVTSPEPCFRVQGCITTARRPTPPWSLGLPCLESVSQPPAHWRRPDRFLGVSPPARQMTGTIKRRGPERVW